MSDVRAIDHDGETYLSAKDLCRVMKRLSLRYEYLSPSARKLINSFVLSVIQHVDKTPKSEE